MPVTRYYVEKRDMSMNTWLAVRDTERVSGYNLGLVS